MPSGNGSSVLRGARTTSACKCKKDLHASARHRPWLCHLHSFVPEAIMMLWLREFTSTRTLGRCLHIPALLIHVAC